MLSSCCQDVIVNRALQVQVGSFERDRKAVLEPSRVRADDQVRLHRSESEDFHRPVPFPGRRYELIPEPISQVSCFYGPSQLLPVLKSSQKANFLKVVDFQVVDIIVDKGRDILIE